MQVIEFIKTSLSTLGEQRTGESLQHVVRELAARGIKANYDPVTDGPSRILLYAARYNARNKMVAECNGLILDYKTWTIVYRPPELPNSQFQVAQVDKNFADYDVFLLNDGTVVGLYFYQDKWRLCTTRGIDMGEVPLFGMDGSANPITYQQALEQAMLTAKVATAGQGVRALTWGELDIDANYTVGFTHPAMHFTKAVGMWLIRAVTEVGDNYVTLDTRQYEIPEQTRTRFDSFREVQQLCASPTYSGWGFLLRSRDPAKTGTDSTILLESRAMTLVRQLVYDRGLAQDAAAAGLTREQYAFVFCLLDEMRRDGYARLYPARSALHRHALQSLRGLADEVLAPRQKNTAAWFRSRMGAVAHLSQDDVLNFMLTREHISVLAGHLVREELLL